MEKLNGLDPAQLVSMAFLGYPSTVHLEGSRLQLGDKKRLVQPLTGLAGQHVVIEEKLDGANSGLSFTAGADLLLQSRGHYLLGSNRERQFGPLRRWAEVHSDALLERLEDRFQMFGETCFAKHSVFYDAMPHWFHEFDVWDRKERCFLSTPRRRELLADSPVLSVPVLYEGPMPTDPALLWSLVRPSLAKTPDWRAAFERAVERQGLPLALCWKQTDQDDKGEGLYLKVEEGDRVVGRFKLVRHSFTQTILDSGSHHQRRPIIPNTLADGVDLFAPRPLVSWEDLGLHTVRSLDELQAGFAPAATNRRRTRP